MEGIFETEIYPNYYDFISRFLFTNHLKQVCYIKFLPILIEGTGSETVISAEIDFGAQGIEIPVQLCFVNAHGKIVNQLGQIVPQAVATSVGERKRNSKPT